MDIIAAYNMISISGQKPSKEKIIELYTAIGAKCESKEIDEFLKKVEGKSFNELLEEGQKKMVVTVGSGAVKTDDVKVDESKKEEEKVEESEEVNYFDDF
ncbi:60S acidic ribosomal protein P2-1 [Dictyocoela muelleri]|nr:60S acidic ribosomal protein P2-1 [Dictyocoela muelleri]